MAGSKRKRISSEQMVGMLSPLWPEEYWRDIPGYEGFYQISSHGRIRSLPRLAAAKGNGQQAVPGGLMKVHKRGHLRLCKDGRPTSHYVTTLLMRAFHAELTRAKDTRLSKAPESSTKSQTKRQWVRKPNRRPGQPHLRRMLELLDPLTQILTDYSERR